MEILFFLFFFIVSGLFLAFVLFLGVILVVLQGFSPKTEQTHSEFKGKFRRQRHRKSFL
jgi:hypothetical protein